MKKSTEIMSGMNELVRLPELNKIMMDMSREMEKVRAIHSQHSGCSTCESLVYSHNDIRCSCSGWIDRRDDGRDVRARRH